MHIVIVALGSAGDVFPFISIGQVLRQRGHEVELLAASAYQKSVESAGLGFVSACSQEQLDDMVADAALWHPRTGFAALWGHLGKMLPSSYALLLERLRPDTILVASSLALNARLAQETLGLKLATVHLAPSFFFSAQDPATRGGLTWLGALPAWAVRRILSLIESQLLDPMICADLDALRATLALAPVRQVFSRWLHSPQRVICAFPAWFAAPQSDWPANTVCTAFPRLAARPGETLGAHLLRFIDAGPAPIAFTPGSVMAHGRQFFQRAIAATEALGRRAVLVTPYRDQLPERLPAFIHHESYAPFDLLAPRMAAFVHHGGIGTSAKVLAAGTPQLITPFAFDQPDNAARLKKLGVAAILAPQASVSQWVRALTGLLQQPRPACTKLAADMARERPAPEQIADLIEELADAPLFQ
ncbi:rhamnosyltransferase subunit B [Oxalobacteraceae bacterium GrIS 1.11]